MKTTAATVGLAASLFGGLAAVGGFAMGYVRGRQDTLYVIWNLRTLAQCVDLSLPLEGDPSDDREEQLAPSRWVWKSGPSAGRPVERFEHGFRNAFKGTPVLGDLGEHLAGYLRVDVANWPPSH